MGKSKRQSNLAVVHKPEDQASSLTYLEQRSERIESLIKVTEERVREMEGRGAFRRMFANNTKDLALNQRGIIHSQMELQDQHQIGIGIVHSNTSQIFQLAKFVERKNDDDRHRFATLHGKLDKADRTRKVEFEGIEERFGHTEEATNHLIQKSASLDEQLSALRAIHAASMDRVSRDLAKAVESLGTSDERAAELIAALESRLALQQRVVWFFMVLMVFCGVALS